MGTSAAGAPVLVPARPREERGGSSVRRLGPLVPALLLLLVFFAGPILWSFYLAFTNTALTGAGAGGSAQFTGLANFRHMLTDEGFRHSVKLTLIFLIATAVIGQNVLGMLIALLMQRRHGVTRAVVGGVVIGAWVIPEVVAGYVWYAFLADDGTLNAILGAVGLESRSWLFVAPMLSVSIANIWRGTAFSMLVYSAALQDVPPDVLEAAAIDGATTTQRLRLVTLPLMKGAITTNLMLVTLQTLAVFGLVYVMTGGGPGNASQVVPIYMYEQSFKFYQLGYGTAVSLVLLVIGAIASFAYVRALKADL